MNSTAYKVAAQYDRVCLVWLTGLSGPFMNLWLLGAYSSAPLYIYTHTRIYNNDDSASRSGLELNKADIGT